MKRYEAYKDSGVEWIGEVPKSWKKIKFKYVTTLMTCGHAATPSYVEEGGRPFLSAQNIKKEEISLSILKQVPEELHNKLTKNHKVEKGDLLQVRVGGADTIGQTAIFNLDFDVSIYVSLAHIKLNGLAHNGYIKHLCNSKEFKGYCGVLMKKGAGVANLNISDVEIMRIPLPPPKEQTQIAAYLDYKTKQLDDLIAKKEQMIGLLEEERTAMINQAVTKGLDPTVAMKDSGIEWLGEIPEHWEVKMLKFNTERITNGYVGPTRGMFHPNGVRYIQSLHIKKNKIDFDRSPYYVSKEWSSEHPRSVLKEGDVLVVQTGAVGEVARVTNEHVGCNCHALIILRVNDLLDSKYLAQLLESPFGKASMKRIETGALHPHINSTKIKDILIPSPDIETQKNIVDYVELSLKHFQLKTKKLKQEINLLKEYKITLISDVVTGKVDVREEVID